MDPITTGALEQKAFAIIIAVFVFVIAVLVLLLWYGWRSTRGRITLCPYTRQPLVLGMDTAKSMARYVSEYMSSLTQPGNPPFDFDNAAICRDTGRIFPNCVEKNEKIFLDWSFLVKRYPGRYISWGSLSEMQQATIRLCHESLEGFQVEFSSPNLLPNLIESIYVLTKPGPLYVDLATKVLLGWKIVPGTEFEVLVVQKPIYQSIDETL